MSKKIKVFVATYSEPRNECEPILRACDDLLNFPKIKQIKWHFTNSTLLYYLHSFYAVLCKNGLYTVKYRDFLV